LAELDGHMNTDSVLETHLLPIGQNSSLRTNNCEQFMRDRTKLIIEEIKKITAPPN
jgi:hypothetical protein